jgi:hypothetical protein
MVGYCYNVFKTECADMSWSEVARLGLNDSSGHVNEFSGFMKDGKFLD